MDPEQPLQFGSGESDSDFRQAQRLWVSDFVLSSALHKVYVAPVLSKLLEIIQIEFMHIGLSNVFIYAHSH